MFNKSIKLYVVYDITSDTICTISESKKNCIEYIKIFTKFKIAEIMGKPHFQSWCELRDIKNPMEQVAVYIKECLPQEEQPKLTLNKIKFTAKMVSESLRLSNGCVPLGGFESDKEKYVLLDAIMKKEAELEQENKDEENNGNE